MTGKIYILSGPSGAGKNTIISALLHENYPVQYIPSYTTRPMRTGEVQGNPYHFVSPDEFNMLKLEREFLETEYIHGHWYGTHRRSYDHAIRNGKNVVKDIDVNGALTFKRQFPNHVCLIYIRPSSLGVLRERLDLRGDDAQDIKLRMKRVDWEESNGAEFDYIVYNDDIEDAVAKVKDIIARSSIRVASGKA